MNKLFLDRIFLNPSYSIYACAYVVYGNKINRKNHNNAPIGRYCPEVDAFNHHLLSIVMPLINPHLREVGYEIKGSNFFASAPNPYFIICRLDNNEMNEEDIKFISKKINSIIGKVTTQSKPSLFSRAFLKKEDAVEERNEAYNI